MWSYSTNCMGPYGLWWFEKYNIPYTTKIVNNQWTKFQDTEYKTYEQWYGGRIDCRCDDENDPDYDPYGAELNLPIMDAESYGKFSDWLFNYTSERLSTSEKLFEQFEKETEHKINFFKEDMYT